MHYTMEATIEDEEFFEMEADFVETAKQEEKAKVARKEQEEERNKRKKEYDKLKLRYLQSLGMVSSPIAVERSRSDPTGPSGLGQALRAASSVPISIPSRAANQSDSEDEDNHDGSNEEYDEEEEDSDAEDADISGRGRSATTHIAMAASRDRSATVPRRRGSAQSSSRPTRFIPPHEMVQQHSFTAAAGSPMDDWKRLRTKLLAKGY